MKGDNDMISFVVAIVTIVAMWKVFVKMGYQGWESIVPFYSNYVMFEAIYGSGWKFLLLFIPLFNIYVMIKLYIDLAKGFGQGGGFAAGLILLTPIFMCILAFGDYDFDASRIY